MRTTLDRFGRVLIPKSLREQLCLKADDVLELAVEDGKLTLLPQRTLPSLHRKGRVLVVESEAEGDVVQVLTQVRQARLDELSR
jgi:AbrB family looped-hinge helix DNA binding protein